VHVAINAQLVSFAQSYRNAGISRYIYSLLEGLARLPGDDRFTVFVSRDEIAAASESPLGKAPQMRLVPVSWPTTRPPQRIAWEQLALPSALQHGHIDVFHAPANVLPWRIPCASVLTVYDVAFLRYPQYFRPTRRYYQSWFIRSSVGRATRIAAISQSTKNDLVECLSAQPERSDVIYPGIAPDFQPIRNVEQLAAFRAAHGLPDRYLLYLGTLEPRKNLVGLVEAYALLREQHDDVPTLVIAGAKGWYYEELFERVQALNLQNGITFAGYVAREEQPLWYSGAEAFVYPSLYEGFGMPVAEALACGIPTVTSNVSSLPEAAGSLALTVDPTDRTALAQAMHQALTDFSLRRRSVVEGPAWVRRFSIENMAESYRASYFKAVERARVALGKRRG
jgi:glycosyltransferase involved in cell wall biosynthesis